MRAPPLVVLTWLGILATPLTAGAACDGSSAPSGPVTLDVDSTPRLFLARVPSAADGRTRAPVVFAFHPFGMNAQYMESRVPGRMWPEAIMLFPEGSRGPGGPSWQGRPGEAADRDLRFFDAMLAWLDERQCVDRSRVFVMGYSNGAGFANVLACARSDRVAGIALAAGRPTCAAGTPKPVIIGHGLRDQTAGYTQAVQAARAWSTVNACRMPPATGATGCAVASGCARGAVTMCTYPGGHEYNTAFTRTFLEFFQGVR
jgi:polyhydroxybutyrate depolymerase